jgi:hypothetical protein
MTSDNRSLSQNWKERIELIGKRNFEIMEMIRLKFLSDKDVAGLEKIQKEIESKLPVIEEINKEIGVIRSELKTLTDVDTQIAEIRKARIAEVKVKRELRNKLKSEQLALKLTAWNKQKSENPTFLGPNVSSKLNFVGLNSSKLGSNTQPLIETYSQLADELGVEPKTLTWLSYSRTTATTDHYLRFAIPKRNGGHRIISTPKSQLKGVQSVIKSKFLDHLIESENATAFKKNASILKNAQCHQNSKVVVRIDLKDFFPSINFFRVRGFFESLGHNPGIASVLALLTTDAPRKKIVIDGKTYFTQTSVHGLPQGTCTSPKLANLIAKNLDKRLNGLATKLPENWTYTRYADDLVFSTKADKSDVNRLLKACKKIVSDEGFQVNDKKTKVMRNPNKMIVTGLLINDRIRIPKKQLRIVRSFLHNCKEKGVKEISDLIGKDALLVAKGYLSFIKMVQPEVALSLEHKNDWIVSNKK